jgi:hypothetical protein
VSALLLLISILFLGFAAHQWMAAIGQVEPTLPLEYRDGPLQRVAFGTYVWNASVPALARRRYLRSLYAMSISFLLIAVAVFVGEQLVPAVLFAGLAAADAAYATISLIKYRALL